MNLIIKTYDSFPCATEEFKINDIEADINDFGETIDTDPSNADDYGCGCMEFEPKLATQAILDKYNITVDEYNIICEKLENELYIGKCGWCI